VSREDSEWIVGNPSVTHRLTTMSPRLQPTGLAAHESERILKVILYICEVDVVYTRKLFAHNYIPSAHIIEEQTGLERKSASKMRLAEKQKAVADNYPPLAHN
jgi:hypothetical protein